MNFVPFCFWADLTVLGSTENSSILLKYSTFEGGFFMLSWEKIKKSLLHCNVRTKIIIKLGKLSILDYKYDFWGQNRLKHTQSIVYARVRASYLYNLGCTYCFGFTFFESDFTDLKGKNGLSHNFGTKFEISGRSAQLP